MIFLKPQRGAIAPGVIYTDRNVEALSDAEYAKKVTASIPAGFYGEPEDCVGVNVVIVLVNQVIEYKVVVI